MIFYGLQCIARNIMSKQGSPAVPQDLCDKVTCVSEVQHELG
jgi:hypothetical protein